MLTTTASEDLAPHGPTRVPAGTKRELRRRYYQLQRKVGQRGRLSAWLFAYRLAKSDWGQR